MGTAALGLGLLSFGPASHRTRASGAPWRGWTDQRRCQEADDQGRKGQRLITDKEGTRNLGGCRWRTKKNDEAARESQHL